VTAIHWLFYSLSYHRIMLFSSCNGIYRRLSEKRSIVFCFASLFCSP